MARIYASYGLLALLGCADVPSGSSPVDDVPTYDEEPATEPSHYAQALTNCSVQTAGHGLVNALPAASGCVLNSQCNSAVKPVCAAALNNACLCTTRDVGGNCLGGRCVWHVDPAITTCVCVPGEVERCTTGEGRPGIQDCNADGSAWSACLPQL
jgi:hypothetical protein